MLATSPKQKHVAAMALAYKHGKLKLSDIPEGAREAVKSMAKMAEDSLRDYTHLAKKPRKKSLLRGSD